MDCAGFARTTKRCRVRTRSRPSRPAAACTCSPRWEQGAECYSAATTRDQAKIVWDVARAMAKRSRRLLRRFGVEVLAHSITVPDQESFFKALSAEDDSLDGLNPHFASVDELHAHKTRGVWDVLETATGAREQSLLSTITTAGSNRSGICYEVRTLPHEDPERGARATSGCLRARGYTIDGDRDRRRDVLRHHLHDRRWR
jgi:hypothetical protein